MSREQPQLWEPRFTVAQFLRAGALVLVISPAAAQDIRGMEGCTAEKQMERRTGCLQANVEFLQQALIKLSREAEDKINAASRDLAATRTELAALKATVEKLNGELEKLKSKAEADSKK